MPATQYRLTNTLDHPYRCLQHSTDWQIHWITLTDACNIVRTDRQQFWQTDKHSGSPLLMPATQYRLTNSSSDRQTNTVLPLLMPATPGPQYRLTNSSSDRQTNTLDRPYWCLQHQDHSTDWQTAVLTDRQTHWIALTYACNTRTTTHGEFWGWLHHCFASMQKWLTLMCFSDMFVVLYVFLLKLSMIPKISVSVYNWDFDEKSLVMPMVRVQSLNSFHHWSHMMFRSTETLDLWYLDQNHKPCNNPPQNNNNNNNWSTICILSNTFVCIHCDKNPCKVNKAFGISQFLVINI